MLLVVSLVYVVMCSVVVIGSSNQTSHGTQDAQSSDDKGEVQSTKDAVAERPHVIEIVPVSATDALDVDAEVAAMSARMDLDLPMISVQIASPMVTSPDKEGDLCLAMEKYANAWTGKFDIDETAVDADDAEKPPGVGNELGRPEAADNAELVDVEDRPLSPTDYTLEDAESDVNQLEIQDTYHPVLLDCRAPSPSEFSLLTESAEENELHRLTQNADVFAIPDPSPSSTEMNMYLAMQYDQLACMRHSADITGNSGTNI